ncbi:DMT family transporter [Agrobacterium vitis]|uniref:EamA family transporter n=1 Tax=Agrobacterium vitis TaxID=373 RepID=A0AAE4WBW0_AGRVI|nr:DMT family transporter [Agrobacterium vitis]MCF1499327.1 DMT family transporter [Allorhizobium sp. Av2]MCM2439424.1 DMT family transporter [Agrobacterium vitis]MUZ57674.1 EamA family transporter [Agrobacterium vitis]
MKGAVLPLAALEAGLVIAWSSGFIGARLAAEATSVFLVLFWRFVIVSLILMPLLIRAIQNGLPARSLILQSVLGIFAMFGYLALGVKAIELGVPVGTAALISALQPIVTAALAGALLQEHVNRSQWIGISLGLAGVSLAVGGSLGGASLGAYVLSGASTLSLVIATIIAKALSDNTPLLPSLAVQSLVSAVLFAPLALLDGEILPSPDIRFIAAVAWFILFSTIGGYGLYWLCLRKSTATRVGSLIYLTPPVTMIWGWLMFSEPITTLAVVGFVICIVGVMLTRPEVRQR